MIRLVVVCAVLAFTHTAGRAQQEKRAQTGMKFLSVTTDPRAAALGDAVTSLEVNSTAMFFNPSGMARLSTFGDVAVGRVNWLADIDYVYGSAAFRPAGGTYGVFGLSVVSVNYGDFIGTIRDNNSANERGYIDTGTFSPGAWAVGLGYAKALNDKFAAGGRVKYVNQDLGSAIVGYDQSGAYVTRGYEENVLAFDFGLLYRSGFRSLNFGMNVNNFSREVKYEEEGFQLPLTFRIGVSMDAAELFALDKERHALVLAVDAVHPRDFSEQVNVGGEYWFANTVALRAGYSYPNDEHGFSAGAGFQKSSKSFGLGVDYAYTPFGVFESVHRFAFHFSL
ncbi:MAG: PorV/PorQ family protein [bacterium]